MPGRVPRAAAADPGSAAGMPGYRRATGSDQCRGRVACRVLERLGDRDPGHGCHGSAVQCDGLPGARGFRPTAKPAERPCPVRGDRALQVTVPPGDDEPLEGLVEAGGQAPLRPAGAARNSPPETGQVTGHDAARSFLVHAAPGARHGRGHATAAQGTRRPGGCAPAHRGTAPRGRCATMRSSAPG